MPVLPYYLHYKYGSTSKQNTTWPEVYKNASTDPNSFPSCIVCISSTYFTKEQMSWGFMHLITSFKETSICKLCKPTTCTNLSILHFHKNSLCVFHWSCKMAMKSWTQDITPTIQGLKEKRQVSFAGENNHTGQNSKTLGNHSKTDFNPAKRDEGRESGLPCWLPWELETAACTSWFKALTFWTPKAFKVAAGERNHLSVKTHFCPRHYNKQAHKPNKTNQTQWSNNSSHCKL